METPPQIVFRIMMMKTTSTAVRVAIAAKIFDALKDRPEVGLKDLAAIVKADATLIRRIMRVLTASGIVVEVAAGLYGHTAVSDSLVDTAPLRDAFCMVYDDHDPALAKLPKFLIDTGFKNPEDAMNGPYQDAFNTSLHRFDYVLHHPELIRVFDSAMAAQRAGRGEDWFNFYPVKSSLLREFPAEQDAVLLVDVGGGEGHDLIAFKARYPDHRGRLVLEDLPNVVSRVSKGQTGIDVLQYDFFTAQPIKAARAYYFRTVLHDWPDAQCRKILQNVVEAMSPTSKILLNEIVLAEKDTPIFPAQMDLAMMATFCSMERTRHQWEVLLNGVGLKIQNIFTPVGATQEERA